MPKTKSKKNLSQRREEAFKLFARGYSNVDVAQELKVSRNTVASYRERYEQSIHAQAAAKPGFLREVLANTIRSLEEVDAIRADAWKQLKNRKLRYTAQCPDCEHEFELKLDMPISDQSRAQYHNVLLKAQDQRGKILGVLGVKAEVLAAITQVKAVQDAILKWMMENLTGEQRTKLLAFMEAELSDYLSMDSPTAALDIIDAEILEDQPALTA